MSGVILAVDTSNYTTSAALCDGREVINTASRLLPVEKGHLGLRQSEAVFHHTRALPEIIGEAVKDGAKSTPWPFPPARGMSKGRICHAFLRVFRPPKASVPCAAFRFMNFPTSRGHIAAAAYGAGRLDLLEKEFIAFHLRGHHRGGCRKARQGKVFKTELAAQTLDLNAGQAVDRVGALLGLGFPAGIELESLL